MLDLKFIILFFVGLIICALVVFFKQSIYNLYKNYDAIQKIHEGYVPPVGGVIIASLFYVGIILKNDSTFLTTSVILLSFVIIILGILEDFSGKLSARLRFIVILFASLVYSYNKETFPSLEIPYIAEIFDQFSYLEILFYAICLTTLSNGINMIDGVNGLASLTSISILVALGSVMLISQNFDSLIYSYELILLIFCVLPFLIFNFPFGKIFLGDAGAYWLGWIIGIFVIEVYSSSSLNTWGAVLILFYPIFEVIFSIARKLINRKSPFEPDMNHLHIKLFIFLKGNMKRSIKFNSFVAVCLMPFWFTPSILVIWSHFFSHISIVFICFMVLIYIYYYLAIPNN